MWCLCTNMLDFNVVPNSFIVLHNSDFIGYWYITGVTILNDMITQRQDLSYQEDANSNEYSIFFLLTIMYVHTTVYFIISEYGTEVLYGVLYG